MKAVRPLFPVLDQDRINIIGTMSYDWLAPYITVPEHGRRKVRECQAMFNQTQADSYVRSGIKLSSKVNRLVE